MTADRARKRVEWGRMAALFTPYAREESASLVCTFAICLLGLVPPLMTARIIDSALPHGSFAELATDIAYIVVSALATAGVAVAITYLNTSVGERIMRDLRTDLAAHLHRLPLRFFTGTSAGQIMNRVNGDVDSVNEIVTTTLTAIVSNTVGILTAVAAMFVLDWQLALVTLPIVLLMVLPVGPVGRKVYAIRKLTRENRDVIGAIIQETLTISGISLIKSFARESYERERLHEAGTHLMKSEIRLAAAGQWLNASLGVMGVLGPAAIWLFGGWLVIGHHLQTGVVVAFVALIGMRLYAPAAALVGLQVKVLSGLVVFERIFEYLDLETEPYSSPAARELPRVRGKIEFEHVCFSYAGGSSEAAGTNGPTRLRDVSFSIAPGQVAAFVGLSGAGKTTIAQLVPRFYDPQFGSVKIDDHDVRTVTIESLRRDIGIVSQETYLFHDTIAANLRYARPGATEAQLQRAARAANIHDFISAMPDGYATVIGERGHRLSGGERQRLAIARVLLKDPRILIFDEATSALDGHNEAAIRSALESVMYGRTSLVIAHRLATIVAADVIFVVEHGRVVENGTHLELLAADGSYARLYGREFAAAR